jgi:hypothetical protein
MKAQQQEIKTSQKYISTEESEEEKTTKEND